ncbi:hypothetical protein J3F84DRAFT_49005 [Trichoderma pleuroticola]
MHLQNREQGTGLTNMPHPQPMANGLRPGKRETRKHQSCGHRAGESASARPCPLACLLGTVSIHTYMTLLPTVWSSIACTVCNRACTVQRWPLEGSWDRSQAREDNSEYCAHCPQTAIPTQTTKARQPSSYVYLLVHGHPTPTTVRQRHDPTAWAHWREGMAWQQSVPRQRRPIRGCILVSGAIPSLCICVQLMLVRTPVPGNSRSGSR